MLSTNIVPRNPTVHPDIVVMSSALETELGAPIINCREGILALHILKIMGHKKSPSTMQNYTISAL
jgi:hypothetical protein